MTIASVMNDEPIPSVTSLAMNKTLHELATLRARSSGSDVILPRHVTKAAQALKNPSNTGTLTSPAATLPEHNDFLCTELNKISNIISNDKILSKMPPKVLVPCHRRGERRCLLHVPHGGRSRGYLRLEAI
jgi:hypothetical protein